MATKSSSKMFLIISSLVLIAGGVGAYFLFRKPKEEKAKDEEDVSTDNKQVTGTVSATKKCNTNTPSELNSTDKIKSFQDWMDAQGKGWIKKDDKWVLLNKGAGYGNYGCSTDAVWKVYGEEYLKKPSNETKNTTTKKTSSQDDINVIINNAKGVKSDKDTLQNKPISWVKNWADAIRNKRKTFFWTKNEGGNDKTYKVIDGQVLLDFVPIGKTYYASKDGRLAKEKASNDASASVINKGENLGKAGDVSYDDKYVFVYFPDRFGDKWIYTSAITSKKPSSSFIGNEMDLDMFSTFDNNLDLNL